MIISATCAIIDLRNEHCSRLLGRCSYRLGFLVRLGQAPSAVRSLAGSERLEG